MSITIKDIAQKAGVSIATVSRVINGTGKVSEKKKEEIEQIIREHHYYPNAAAKSLITHASDMIGLVMPERVNPLFVQVLYVDKIFEKRGKGRERMGNCEKS